MSSPAEHARFLRRRRQDWWTSERQAFLELLLRDPRKLLAVDIARELGGGATKMAVIGRCHRLGLKLPNQAGSHGRPAGKRTSKPRKAATGHSRGRQASWALPRTTPMEQIMTDPDTLPLVCHCTLFELTNSTCRWPLNDGGRGGYLFCGRPGADMHHRQPYCIAHTRMAYAGRRGPETPRTHVRSAYDPMGMAP